MEFGDRQQRIIENLRPKPIHHGQLEVFLIAIPEPEEVSLERWQLLRDSLEQQGSNLVPIVVRRTDAYDPEEYEVVYGADWCQVAKELTIDRLWAWVFDLTDAQVQETKQALAELMYPSVNREHQPESATTLNPEAVAQEINYKEIDNLIERKLQLATTAIKQSLTTLLDGTQNDLNGKLVDLDRKIEILSDSLSTLPEILDQINKSQQQIISGRQKREEQFSGEKIELISAEKQQIKTLLGQVGAQTKQIEAAVKAIEYWKQTGNLTWENLKISTKKRSEHKIADFAEGTLDRLKKIGTISEP
jgi:hypothetical protein